MRRVWAARGEGPEEESAGVRTLNWVGGGGRGSAMDVRAGEGRGEAGAARGEEGVSRTGLGLRRRGRGRGRP